jgi:hypothetical protein
VYELDAIAIAIAISHVKLQLVVYADYAHESAFKVEWINVFEISI